MVTDYDEIAEEYREIKNEPWRLYCEEYMMRKLVGDVTGKSVLDLACGEGHSFEMEVYHYSQATYDWALQTAGLSRIVWHRPEVAQEGIDRFGSEYWDYWTNHPFLMGLEATR